MRVSRTVLREAAGEIPPAYSPSVASALRGRLSRVERIATEQPNSSGGSDKFAFVVGDIERLIMLAGHTWVLHILNEIEEQDHDVARQVAEDIAAALDPEACDDRSCYMVSIRQYDIMTSPRVSGAGRHASGWSSWVGHGAPSS